MPQVEGSLVLGSTPALHRSPEAARVRWAAVGLLIVLALSAIALPADATQPALPAAAELRAADAYARTPLAFVPNAGQADERVRYHAQGAGYSFYFTDHKAVLALQKGERGHALELRFLGANPRAELEAADRGSGRVNYLTGAEHHTDLPTYGRVVYRELWPGIDMAFRGEGGKLRYEFRLRPGAEASDIRLAYAGAGDLSLGERGALLIDTPLGALRDAPPQSFQRIEGRRVAVESRYALAGDSYGFSVGRHDRRRPLVIDPSLSYSTYLGGSSVDTGLGIAVDSAGAAYVTGLTVSTNFPATAGAFDTDAGAFGDTDVFVTKLNPAGSGLSYSTYLGGSRSDIGRGVAVDSAGAAYVTGRTDSADFPTTAGAYDTRASGGDDAFVTKLNPAGSGLSYSTYLGGSAVEDGDGVVVDAAGAAYVAGATSSGDFPTSAGAFDRSFNGDRFQFDAFVTKLNPAGSGLSYSTYLGGSSFDQGFGVAVDSARATYVTGLTGSTGFPTTAGAFDASVSDLDAFVTKLNPAGSGLSYSTYLGGSSYDEGQGIAVDAAGAAYVTGNTSGDFPTTPGAFDTSANGGGFVTKLNPAGSGLSYSTHLGPATGLGIAVDSSGAAYVTGLTGSTDFPTTAGAFETSFNGGTTDAFLTKLNPAGSGLSYSTYLGGASQGEFGDEGRGVAVDSAEAAYVTGFTNSADFPTTAGVFDTSANGNTEAFITKFALGPGFSAAVDLDAGAACCPQVASDGEGDAVAVWTHSDASGTKVRVRSISAAGALGPVKRLSGTNPGPAGLPDPQIASDADVDAIAVFSRRGPRFWRAKARMISPGGVLGPSITLSAAGGDAFNVQIASDAAGDAVAVWERFDGANWRVQARTISRGAALGPVLNLSAAGEDALSPQIVSDADGDSVAVWERFDGTNWQVEARMISRTGALGAVLNLSVAGKDRYDAQVTIDGQGDAVAVWASTLNRETPREPGQTIQARSISRTGALGTIVRLPAAGREDLADGPQIASDADGDAVAIWTVERLSTPDDDFAVQLRRIARAGALGPVTDLDTSVAESPLEQAQIASDADGDAVAIWHQQYFGACEGGGDVLARPISRAGVLGPTTTLSEQPVSPGGEPLCGFDSDAPQIASDADGDVIAVWEFDDFESVQMSQGP